MIRSTLLLLLLPAAAIAGPFTPTITPVSPDGVRATCDLPAVQHIRNTGGIGPRGPGSGAGLCVFTSAQVAARWQNVPGIEGFQEFMTRREGGGWPEKLDAMLTAFCKGKPPDYLQHTGGDDGFLDLAVKTGRMPAVTYAGLDDFYRDRAGNPARIAHMVNLAHLDADHAAIVDNNRPGRWVWMSRRDFLARWRDMNGGWAFVWLSPPPPPHPAAPVADGPVFGQCVNGRCYPPGRAPAPAEPDGWVWVEYGGPDTGYWKLHAGGRLVGVYDAKGWHAAVTATAWEAATGPLPAGVDPPPGAGAAESVPTGGVVPDRVHESPRYAKNGRPVTAAEAERSLTDDSDRRFVVAVGDAAFVARVRADCATRPVHFVGLDPGAWQVATYDLSPGVTVRNAAVARVGADAGRIEAADYSAAALTAVLDGKPVAPVAPVAPQLPAWLIPAALAFLAGLFLRSHR